MSAYISWVNPNVGSTVKVFRSTTAIDKENLPAPLVTLTNNEQFYVDATAKFGDHFFYLIEAELDGQIAFSRQIEMTVTVDTGPGPADLRWGDMYLGFFGIVQDFELGFSLSQWYNSAPDTRYFKIYYKGRILFVGAPVINTGKNANALIAAKIFNTGIKSRFGVDPEAGAEVRTIQGRRFAPRIAKYYDDENTLVDPISYSINFVDGMPFGQSEFIDLYRLTVRSLVRATTAPFRFAHSTAASTVPMITSDYTAVGRTTVAGFATAPAPATLGLGLTSVAMNSANNSFIPVLEFLGS